MMQRVADFFLVSLGAVVALFSVAVGLVYLAAITAPFWGIGLLCLWMVGWI